MRTRLAITILLASLIPAVAAAAGTTSGIEGKVLDTTCYGPCTYPPSESPPYTGGGLTVSVKTLPDRVRIAKLHPPDGNFKLEAPPGTYRVRARVKGECWQADGKRVEVPEGDYAGVVLRVYNACIL